jgi:alkane 1-monooxygenase
MGALQYLLSFILILSAGFSFTQHGLLSYTTLFIAFGAIPLLELFIKPDASNASDDVKNQRLQNKAYDLLLYAIVPLQFCMLFWFLWNFTHQPNASYTTLVGWLLAMGILNGAFGINVAHELGHRPSKKEQFLSQLLLLSTLYMHFYIEHNRGHHKYVSTPQDPASARKNEILYFFWIRAVVQSYSNAWKLEKRRLKNSAAGPWSFQNAMLQYSLFQVVFVASISILFGWKASLFFLISALLGILLLETINYIEHYGLLRKKISELRYEDVKPCHSWNSNHRVGRLFLFELSRHSDHHHRPAKKYQILEHTPNSPQMPTGYPGMMLLSLLPPLFFWVMNKRIPPTL